MADGWPWKEPKVRGQGKFSRTEKGADWKGSREKVALEEGQRWEQA